MTCNDLNERSKSGQLSLTQHESKRYSRPCP